MFDIQNFVQTAGVLGVAFVIFAESGLLIGFFLPGDGLLFTAGLIAAGGYLDVGALVILTFIAAVTGDTVGYYIGHKAGPKIFTREKSPLFNPAHVMRAKVFFGEHGPKAIIMARFLPIVRTLVPTIAGVAAMNYRTFLIYNVLGGFLWTVSMTLGGFYLGKVIPNIDHYLLPIILLITALSFLPTVVSILRKKK